LYCVFVSGVWSREDERRAHLGPAAHRAHRGAGHPHRLSGHGGPHPLHVRPHTHAHRITCTQGWGSPTQVGVSMKTYTFISKIIKQINRKYSRDIDKDRNYDFFI